MEYVDIIFQNGAPYVRVEMLVTRLEQISEKALRSGGEMYGVEIFSDEIDDIIAWLKEAGEKKDQES